MQTWGEAGDVENSWTYNGPNPLKQLTQCVCCKLYEIYVVTYEMGLEVHSKVSKMTTFEKQVNYNPNCCLNN